MKQTESPMQKIVFIVAILCILACPALFLAGTFAPRALSFLDPVLCPHGLRLDRATETQHDLRGSVTSVNAVCVGDGKEVDVTGKMLVILLGLPILGVILLVVWIVLIPGRPKPTASEV